MAINAETLAVAMSYTKNSKANHYSTDEQVVGTWIDGKPVYEKSYSLQKSNFVKTNSKHYTFDYGHSSLNINQVISMQGTLHLSATGWGTTDIPLGGRSDFTNDAITNFIEFVSYYSYLAVKSDAFDLEKDTSNWSCAMTIRYTKTTD